MLRIGILALQGCVQPHIEHFRALNVDPALIRFKHQLEHVDGLVIPGGESTTMLHLLDLFDIYEPLKNFAKIKPIWGICAGAILMAKKVENTTQKSLEAMSHHIARNAYGRQAESFQMHVQNYPVSFIRAPQIGHISNPEGTTILAKQDKMPIWIEEGKHMVTTFHPELTRLFPSPMHHHFMEKVRINISDSSSH